MKNLGLSIATLCTAVPLLSAFATPVLAQDCNPAQTASHLVGDDYYMCGGPGYAGWDCNPSLRSQFWDRYGFEFDSWSGRGYYEPCDNSQKLAQTFNAIAVLAFAHTDSPNCDFFVEHVAVGGECYAADRIKVLRARVGDGSAYASRGTWPNDRRVTLYNPFFTQNVALRAGTLYHEARHAHDCGHNADDSSCKRGESCDKSWNNGCPAAGDDAGANRYQITFLRAYYVSSRSTKPLRDAALLKANDLLEDSFRDDPCFRFDQYGVAQNSCN